MSEYSDFVKQLADRFTSQSKRLEAAAETVRAQEAFTTAQQLIDVADELDRLENMTTAIPRSLGDVSDLPPELVAELSSVKTDEMEDHIVTIINACGGVANIDQILVGLYRKFRKVEKRRFVQNKLYRMMKSELIFSVPGKKGLYATSEQDESAVNNDDLPEDPQESEEDFEDEIPF